MSAQIPKRTHFWELAGQIKNEFRPQAFSALVFAHLKRQGVLPHGLQLDTPMVHRFDESSLVLLCDALELSLTSKQISELSFGQLLELISTDLNKNDAPELDISKLKIIAEHLALNISPVTFDLRTVHDLGQPFFLSQPALQQTGLRKESIDEVKNAMLIFHGGYSDQGPKTVTTSLDHPLFSRVQEGLGALKKLLGPASTIAEPYLNEIQRLFIDSASMVSTSGLNFGDGSAGYHSVRALTSKKNLAALQTTLPQAFAAALQSKPQRWTEWMKHFSTDEHPQGDSELALLGLLLSQYWFRHALDSCDLYLFNVAHPLDATRSLPYDSSLFDGAFEQEDIHIFGSQGEKHWGNAYKTFSGIGMGAAMAKWGHSESSVVATMRWAGIAYEAVDLLYDHLQVRAPTQALQKTHDSQGRYSYLQKVWADFSKRISDCYNNEPKFRQVVHNALLGGFKIINPKRPLGALAGALGRAGWDALAWPLLQKRKLLDADSPFEIAVLVLALLDQDADMFAEDGAWASLRIEHQDFEALLQLIKVGIQDFQLQVQGAKAGHRFYHTKA